MEVSHELFTALVYHGEREKPIARTVTLGEIRGLEPRWTQRSLIVSRGIAPACAETTVIILFVADGQSDPDWRAAQIAVFGLRYGDGCYQGRLRRSPEYSAECQQIGIKWRIEPIQQVGREVAAAISLTFVQTWENT